MGMEATVQVLASGSTGNAVFVRIGEVRLLIDAGISFKRIQSALEELGEEPQALTAVLLTHEHNDHVKGLRTLKRKCPDVPVLATRGTARALAGRSSVTLSSTPLRGGQSVRFGPVRVLPIDISHDCREPVAFRIECGDFALGLATDLGFAGAPQREALSGCSVLILEANHSEELLLCGPYPAFLQRRVSSARGHLSNRQAADLLGRIAGPQLRHVIFGHMSRSNNTAERVLQDLADVLGRIPAVEASVARFDRPGEPLRLRVGPAGVGHKTAAEAPVQLALSL
jgi:phosphoribosyl 1,2-cyclic phosphodiesterase